MSYKKQLEDAQKELLRLERQKTAIERQIGGLIQVIEGLRVLSGQHSSSDLLASEAMSVDPKTPSLPKKVLAILAKEGAPVSVTHIRDRLIVNRAVDATTKNLVINIHTTLKRLIKAGKVTEVQLDDGSKLYVYVSPLQRALKISAPTSFANTIVRTSKKM